MSRAELRNQPVLRVYDQYFKLYGQNYPVLYQIESVAIKGRSIPIVNCLVTAMFIAELKNMLLTAGHDFDKVEFPIVADIGDGDRYYTLINDTEKLVCDNDMLICDDKGVISSVIYGPDKRTAITAETQNVLFVVYAPENIDKQDTLSHLEDIKIMYFFFSESKIDFMAVSIIVEGAVSGFIANQRGSPLTQAFYFDRGKIQGSFATEPSQHQF